MFKEEEIFLATRVIGKQVDVVGFTCETECPCRWDTMEVLIIGVACLLLGFVITIIGTETRWGAK